MTKDKMVRGKERTSREKTLFRKAFFPKFITLELQMKAIKVNANALTHSD
jgi:hypothetical protein